MWLFRWVHVFLLNQIVPPALYFIQPKTKNQSRVQRIDKHVVNALSLTHTETCSSTYSLDRVVHTRVLPLKLRVNYQKLFSY